MTMFRFSTSARGSVVLAALASALLLVTPISSLAQPTLFNTGVDGANALLALGSADPHYNVVENANLSAFVVTNQLVGTYVQSATAQWIWQQANGQPGSVARTFRQIFDLTGFNPATASITGRYAADNSATILLNGILVGVASPGFTAFTNFSLNTNFVAGVNTLDFVAVDVGAPGGLIVDQLSLSASPLGGAAAPEPTTLALVALFAPAGLTLLRRRNRAN